MPKEPKHHYIPVFYLQQWADQRSRMVEYSRQGPDRVVKTRPTSPTGTGFARGLYRVEDVDPSVVNAVETLFLKPSDGLAAEALQSFLQGEAFPRPELRTSWARFVLSLMLRYPEAVALMKRQLRQNVEKIYEQTKQPDEPATFAEYEASRGTQELARVHGRVLMGLMQDSRMGRLLFGMYWGVLKFQNYNHNLLTSDRPIVSNIFRLSAHHLCMPISPEVIWVACATTQAQQEFRRIGLLDVMAAINDVVVRQAQIYVWGTKDASQLRFVKSRMGRRLQSAGPYLV
jgi:hypothetical protein